MTTFLLVCLSQAAWAMPVADMASWRITTDADARPAEAYAAEEFRRLFRESTGIDLPLARDAGAAGTVRIALSPTLADEESRIRTGPDSIVIEGGRPRGTLYGVYRFFEDFLGTRFLTADHTHVPRNPLAVIPAGDRHYRPVFSYRWSYYREASAHPEFAARLRINTLTPEPRLGGVPDESFDTHSFQHQVPVDRYGAEHPEYFAWVDGRRDVDTPGIAPQLCSTNPEVVDRLVEALRDELRGHPDRRAVMVTTNDNDRYCRCPDCAAVNAREGSPMGAHLALVNAVADRIARDRPDVTVMTLAYWYTLAPPRHLRPRDNVRIWVCSFDACGLHDLDDPGCPPNAAFMEHFDGWTRICRDLRFWYYNTHLRSLDMPYPNLHSLGRNVRLFRDRGVGGVFMQGNDKCPAGELSDLRNYLTARLLWDPDLEAEALLEEFLRLHYGPAAPPIRDYIEAVRDAAERSGAHPYCWTVPAGIGLDPDTAGRLMALFDDALARAPDVTVRRRVEKASIAAYKALFETQGRLVYDGGKVRLEYPPGVTGRLPRYVELCDRYGMTYDSEFGSRDDFVSSLESHLAGAPAVRLESRTWRLTAIPAMGGEVVELYHKPGRRHLLRAWDRPNINLPRGTLGEQIRTVKGPDAPQAFDYEATSRSLQMRKTLDDGTTVEHRIALPRLRPKAVVFDTVVRRQGSDAAEYRIAVRGEAASEGEAVAGRSGFSDESGRVTIAGRGWDTTEFTPAPALGDVRVELRSPGIRLDPGETYRSRYRLNLR